MQSVLKHLDLAFFGKAYVYSESNRFRKAKNGDSAVHNHRLIHSSTLHDKADIPNDARFHYNRYLYFHW